MLRTQTPGDRRRLILTFSGVCELRFLRAWEAWTQLHSFDVRPVSDHQREGIHYHVIDVEEEGPAVWCAEYQATITEQRSARSDG